MSQLDQFGLELLEPPGVVGIGNRGPGLGREALLEQGDLGLGAGQPLEGGDQLLLAPREPGHIGLGCLGSGSAGSAQP